MGEPLYGLKNDRAASCCGLYAVRMIDILATHKVDNKVFCVAVK